MRLKVVKVKKGYIFVDESADIQEGDNIWYKRLGDLIGEAGEDNLDKEYFSKIIVQTAELNIPNVPYFPMGMNDNVTDILLHTKIIDGNVVPCSFEQEGKTWVKIKSIKIEDK